jgi:phage-related protein
LRTASRLPFNFGGSPQICRIRSTWRRLARLEQLRDPSERGLRHFVRRQTGCDAVEWLTPQAAASVIEALKSWCSRVE